MKINYRLILLGIFLIIIVFLFVHRLFIFQTPTPTQLCTYNSWDENTCIVGGS